MWGPENVKKVQKQVEEVMVEMGWWSPPDVNEKDVEEFCETRRFRQEMLKMWGVKHEGG